MNAISLNNLWSYLQGLSLTSSNRRWLAEHLIEEAERTEDGIRKKKIDFPKIPKDYKPSARVLAMSLGLLPEGVDLEKEKNRCEE